MKKIEWVEQLVKLKRTTHNGLKCYKDETKLFMITKKDNGKWELLKANSDSYNTINELRAWGYTYINENWEFNNFSEVIGQILYELQYSYFDEFQSKIKNDYLEELERRKKLYNL